MESDQPPILTIKRLWELSAIMKLSILFRRAGLNDNTLRSAMHNRRELRPDEAEAIQQALASYGVALLPPRPPSLFDELEASGL